MAPRKAAPSRQRSTEPDPWKEAAKSFAKSINERIKPVCAKLEVESRPLVKQLAQDAARLVKALVPAQYREAVLSDPELAEHWPCQNVLYGALDSGSPSYGTRFAVLSRHPIVGDVAPWPHERASIADAANLLKAANTPESLTLAQLMLDGRLITITWSVEAVDGMRDRDDEYTRTIKPFLDADQSPVGHITVGDASGWTIAMPGLPNRKELEDQVWSAIKQWPPMAIAWITVALNKAKGAEQARKPPALVRLVYDNAVAFHSRGVDFDPNSRTLTFAGRELAKLAGNAGASFDLDVILRGLGLLGGVAAHRLFRWEVMTGHDQYLAQNAYPNVLEVDGGWAALAQILGLNPDKQTGDIRSIVHAQAHFRFSFPDGSQGNMLSYQERDARGRSGRAKLMLTLGTPLLPGYVHELPQRQRKLVPLLRELPPLYGRANEHGQQLTMSLAVMGELRARAKELAQNGAVRMTQDDFDRLGDRSGLPRRLRLPVIEAWVAGDTRAKPFLERVDRDRYTLADAHQAERDFLVEAGHQELDGASAGRKGSRAKHAKVRRKSGN